MDLKLTLTTFISRLALLSGGVSIVAGFANVFYVGYALRSMTKFFPVELVYSPVLVLLGVFFVSASLEIEKLNYLDNAYTKFKQKTQNEKYLDGAKKGAILVFFLFALPTMTNGIGSHKLRVIVENNFLYTIGNFSLLLLFFVTSLALGVRITTTLKNKIIRSGK